MKNFYTIFFTVLLFISGDLAANDHDNEKLRSVTSQSDQEEKAISIWENIPLKFNNYFCAQPLHRQIRSMLLDNNYDAASAMVPQGEQALDTLLEELVRHKSCSNVLAFLLSEYPELINQKGALLLLSAVFHDNVAAVIELFRYDVQLKNIDALISALFRHRKIDGKTTSSHRSAKMRRLIYEKVPSITLNTQYRIEDLQVTEPVHLATIKELEEQIGSDMSMVKELFKKKSALLLNN